MKNRILLFLLSFLAFQLNAQTNLLTNPGFDDPEFINIGEHFTFSRIFNGWSISTGEILPNGTFNIIKTDGIYCEYGPCNAQDGNQYIEIYNGTGAIYQDFTITGCNKNISFGGSFSSRSAETWTANIQIISLSSGIGVQSNSKTFIPSDDSKVWFTLSGKAVLPPGNYRYIANLLGDNGNFDAAFVKESGCSWNGTTGNWSDDTKWSCGHVPTTSDDVVICGGIVTLDAPVSISNMTMLGGTIDGNGKSLALSNALTWSGGTMNGEGTTTVTGATTITNAPTLDARTLTFNGGGSINGGFTTNNSANLLIPVGQTLTATINSDLVWGGSGGTLTIGGTFSKVGAILELGVQNVQNSGTVNINGNTLRMSAGGTHNEATFNIEFGAYCSAKGGTHTFTNCHFSGGGGLATIGTGIISSFTGNDLLPGSILRFSGVENSTFNLGQDFDFNAFLIGGNHVFNGTGNLNVGDVTILDGSVNYIGNLITTGDINFSKGNINITGNFSINGNITWNWSGGTIGNNVITNLIYPAKGISNNNVTMNGIFNNGSSFTVKSGTFTANNAFSNSAVGSLGFPYYGSLSIEAGVFDANSTFDNIGGEIKGKGSLDLTHAIVSNIGWVAPGLSSGRLTIVGDYVSNNNAYLSIEIGGTTLGIDCDQLSITGNATLSGGQIFLDLVNGYTPVIGHSFTILDAVSLTGTFDTPIGIFEFAGFNWQLIYSPTEGTIVLNVVGSILPVELLSFKAQNTEGGNLLTWQTANEVNNKGFQIERIMDNGQWIMLGFVHAKGKSSTYEFTDNAPISISYYRLRQIDNDGKETLSKVISVSNKQNSKLIPYPNPVSNVLTVETTETGDYQILNLLGQQVLKGKATSRIDVSALPQGTYFLKIGAEQVKFVKQ